MARNVKALSSDQLFAMAEKRKQEENKKAKEENKTKLAALRSERKKMLTRHKRELAKIDDKIREMGGRTRVRASKAKQGSQTGISAMVLEILEAEKKADTKHIRATLESKGVSTANLGQTLAYLKRTGRVKSAARGVYSLK